MTKAGSIEYDWYRKRWACLRPYPLRWSEIVLGRRETQLEVIKNNGFVKVSCWATVDGRRFYTKTKGGPAGKRVLYRVNVKFKKWKE